MKLKSTLITTIYSQSYCKRISDIQMQSHIMYPKKKKWYFLCSLKLVTYTSLVDVIELCLVSILTPTENFKFIRLSTSKRADSFSVDSEISQYYL